MDDEDRRFDLLTSLVLLGRELRRKIAELMADERRAIDAGFRPPSMGVMAMVARFEPVSQRQISDYLGMDASDVVGALDILESARLLERRRDPRDRRRHAVVLTEEGKRVNRRFAALRAEAEDRVLAHLDADERRLLADLVDRAIAPALPAPADTALGGANRPGVSPPEPGG